MTHKSINYVCSCVAFIFVPKLFQTRRIHTEPWPVHQIINKFNLKVNSTEVINSICRPHSLPYVVPANNTCLQIEKKHILMTSAIGQSPWQSIPGTIWNSNSLQPTFADTTLEIFASHFRCDLNTSGECTNQRLWGWETFNCGFVLLFCLRLTQHFLTEAFPVSPVFVWTFSGVLVHAEKDSGLAESR